MTVQLTSQSFNKLASDYCTFLEDHCAYSAKQFTTQCAAFLAAIDQVFEELPEVDATDTSGPDIGPTQWIARNIIEKLADQDRSVGSLSDELTQIYRYLKHGLLIYTSDPASAVAYWKAHFAVECQGDLQRARATLN